MEITLTKYKSLGRGGLRMNRIYLIFLAILISALNVTPSFSGANPKGKPFVAIQGQIVEVKGDRIG